MNDKTMTIFRNFPSNFKLRLCAIFGTVMVAKTINPKAIPIVRTFSQIHHLMKPRDFYDDLELPRTASYDADRQRDRQKKS